MRLIDADKLTELCDIMADKCDGIGEGVWHQFKTTIEWSPTIDAVPVVRCKDCKRFAPDKDGGDWGMCIDEGGMMLTPKDFGCLGGERKADDETD